MGKRGRPKAEVKTDPAYIAERAAAHGMTDEEIALLLGLSEATMKRRFAKALKQGRISVKFNIAESIVAMAEQKKSPAVNIFLAKARLGWREYQVEKPEEEQAPIFVRGPDRPSVARVKDQTDESQDTEKNGTK